MNIEVINIKNRKLSRKQLRRLPGGIFLFFTFFLCITPRQTLHNIFADHVDTKPFYKGSPGTAHLTHITVNCDCSTIVATSAFAENDIPVISLLSTGKFNNARILPHQDIVCISYYTVLRGPPVQS